MDSRELPALIRTVGGNLRKYQMPTDEEFQKSLAMPEENKGMVFQYPIVLVDVLWSS